MAERATEVKVGITVVVALVLLVLGTAWMAEVRLNRDGYEIYVLFDRVGGLAEGDPVSVAGVEMGRVKGIELRPRDVKVRLWISREARLTTDTRAAVETAGLMGEKFVSLQPGPAVTVLEPGAEIVGEYRQGLQEATAGLGKILAAIDTLASRLDAVLLGGPSSPGGAEGVVGDAAQAARELREALAENRSDLREAVRNLRVVSEETRELVQERRPELEDTLTRLARAAHSLEATADRLGNAAGPIVRTGERVAAGEGTLGKLVRDDSLYVELRRTARSLDSLVSEVRANPHRFFKVSIF